LKITGITLTMATGAAPPVPSLLRWGISADADLVYRTLILFGPLTVAGLARELGLAPARVDRAVAELAALPAVALVAVPGRARDGARRWTAAPVDRVLTAVRNRRVHGRSQPSGRWRKQLAAAGIDPFALDDDSVRLLTSRAAARQRIVDLVGRERHEHLTINTEQVVSADAAQAATPLDRELLARGLRVRTLGPPAGDGDLSSAYTLDLAALGGEHRQSDALPMKLMLFDRTHALLAVDPDDFEAGAVEITDPIAVSGLSLFFHRLWAEGRDPRRNGVPPIVLTPREQAIVTLLATGHSEESAASQLGLGRRTVLYALRGLMDRLCIENRFQLAVVLGAAGAVTVPALHQKE
jgi:DNA-binding CsgD family transcriptional regulator